MLFAVLAHGHIVRASFQVGKGNGRIGGRPGADQVVRCVIERKLHAGTLAAQNVGCRANADPDDPVGQVQFLLGLTVDAAVGCHIEGILRRIDGIILCRTGLADGIGRVLFQLFQHDAAGRIRRDRGRSAVGRDLEGGPLDAAGRIQLIRQRQDDAAALRIHCVQRGFHFGFLFHHAVQFFGLSCIVLRDVLLPDDVLTQVKLTAFAIAVLIADDLIHDLAFPVAQRAVLRRDVRLCDHVERTAGHGHASLRIVHLHADDVLGRAERHFDYVGPVVEVVQIKLLVLGGIVALRFRQFMDDVLALQQFFREIEGARFRRFVLAEGDLLGIIYI